MSSSTTRVSLYKPASGENVNVTTDLNNNWDKVDTNLNFRVAASQTARYAITPYWEGLSVRDTDTGRTWVSNGSSPQSGSWKEVLNSGATFSNSVQMISGTQVNIGGSSSTASFTAQNPTTGADFLSARIPGDTQSRYLVDTDGKTWFGPGGASTQDTNIYRDSANVLATDDEFLIKGGNLQLSSGGASEINAQPSVQTVVANTTTETVIATYTIPANDMTVGAVYRITCWGIASVTGTPTMIWKNRMGGVAGTGNATITITAASGVTNKVWRATFLCAVQAIGASGTWHGNLEVNEGISATGTNPIIGVVRMDGNSTVSVDTTVSQAMVITAKWSAASASNTMTCQGFAAERVA